MQPFQGPGVGGGQEKRGVKPNRALEKTFFVFRGAPTTRVDLRGAAADHLQKEGNKKDKPRGEVGRQL